MRNLFGRLRKDEEGTAILEGAIVLPVVIILAFGVFEFANVFFQHQVVTAGLRDAARFAARFEDPMDREPEAQNLATRASINVDGAPRLRWWEPGDVQVTTRTISNAVDPDTGRRPYRGGPEVLVVRVETDAQFETLGFLGMLGLNRITMTVAHEERVIGG
jgi:hypothetical protein